MRGLRAAQFVEDAGPLAHPVRPETYKEINNFYTATVYEKGAEVVRMVQTLIGPEKFRAGMDLYFERHDGEAATIEQFIQCFADVSGRDMAQFMRWYAQAGTPEVTVSGRYDAAAKTYTLEAKQTLAPTPGQPTKEPMVIPLGARPRRQGRPRPAAEAGERRNDRARRAGTRTRPRRHLSSPDIAAPPVPSINRGFSAPIKLVTDLTADDLAFLAAHDSDPFNRWQALQTISMRLLIDNVAALRAHHAPRNDDKLMLALASILEDAALEPAFVALALVPPGEGDVAREIGKDIDPDAVFRARKALRVEIGTVLDAALETTYERMTVPGGFTPDATSAGRRALRNVCLDLMAAAGSQAAIARAMRQYEAADNMTDRMAALATLSSHDVPERAQALADFYRRYQADHLVVDKWLALQADSPRGGHASSGARAHQAPGLLDGEPQPRAGADRRLRARQSDPVQPGRRRRLRFRRRRGAQPRPEEPADLGAACHRLPQLAHA